jgi:tetratricopeptide (TPR) repeat protein
MRFVDHLRSRFRRVPPVLLLSIPVILSMVRLVPHARADLHLARARRVVTAVGGAMDLDPQYEASLRSSLAAEPGVDAYRQLSVLLTATGRAKEALVLLDELSRISPNDELGRIERARALVAVGQAKDAIPLLDKLVLQRPFDDIVRGVRATALWFAGRKPEARDEVFSVLRESPIDTVRRFAAMVASRMPELVLPACGTALRIGEKDSPRALAILEGLGDGEPDFHRALVLTATAGLDEAMDALRDADAAGVDDFSERVKNDPRLDPLRTRADFQQMISR